MGVARHQVEGHAGLAPPGATAPLLGVGAADCHVVERLHAPLRVEALLFHAPRIDDVSAVVDGHRRLGNVRREHHLAHARRWPIEDSALLLGGEKRVQGKDPASVGLLPKLPGPEQQLVQGLDLFEPREEDEHCIGERAHLVLAAAAAAALLGILGLATGAAVGRLGHVPLPRAPILRHKLGARVRDAIVQVDAPLHLGHRRQSLCGIAASRRGRNALCSAHVRGARLGWRRRRQFEHCGLTPRLVPSRDHVGPRDPSQPLQQRHEQLVIDLLTRPRASNVWPRDQQRWARARV